MATSSFAKTLLGGLDAAIKRALGEVLDYVFNGNLSFGPVDTTVAQSKTDNFRGRYVKVTTSGTANQEVAIAHGLGRKPNVMWQVIPPSVTNAQWVTMTNSRAADENRIYLTSGSTAATTWIYCE